MANLEAGPAPCSSPPFERSTSSPAEAAHIVRKSYATCCRQLGLREDWSLLHVRSACMPCHPPSGNPDLATHVQEAIGSQRLVVVSSDEMILHEVSYLMIQRIEFSSLDQKAAVGIVLFDNVSYCFIPSRFILLRAPRNPNVWWSVLALFLLSHPQKVKNSPKISWYLFLPSLMQLVHFGQFRFSAFQPLSCEWIYVILPSITWRVWKPCLKTREMELKLNLDYTRTRNKGLLQWFSLITQLDAEGKEIKNTKCYAKLSLCDLCLKDKETTGTVERSY